MATLFRNPGPALTDADVSPEGNRLGVTLPPAYRRWLLTTNGGTPKPSSFRTCTGEPSAKLSVEAFAWFPPAGHRPRESVVDTYGHLVSELAMPRHLLPVAKTTAEGFLLLDLRGDDGGPVYDWSPMSPSFAADETAGRVTVVALGIAELLAAFGVTT